jgi:mono/diheme cytochrome c family protein
VKRLTLLFALVVALGAAGCGGGEDDSATPETVEGTLPADTSGGGGGGAEGDPEAGAEVFAEAGCGGCHVFEPAGSSGSAGPNLDEADVSFEDAVAQIENGGGGMPPFEGQLSDQQIADVAAFVTQG